MTKKTTLRMSFIPLAIIIVLIIGAGYFLLQGDIKLPKFNSGPQVRRLEGFPTVVYTDKPIQKQRIIIKSQEQLNTFLNTVDSTGLLVLKDKINFDKEFLIAASTDVNDETGHKLKIKKVYEDKEKKMLIVSVEETEKGEFCEVEKDKNVAVDLVAISKTDWNFKFEKTMKSDECPQPESTPTTTK